MVVLKLSGFWTTNVVLKVVNELTFKTFRTFRTILP